MCFYLRSGREFKLLNYEDKPPKLVFTRSSRCGSAGDNVRLNIGSHWSFLQNVEQLKGVRKISLTPGKICASIGRFDANIPQDYELVSRPSTLTVSQRNTSQFIQDNAMYLLKRRARNDWVRRIPTNQPINQFVRSKSP